MSDLERDLREHLRSADLPTAPPTLLAALDEVVRQPVGPPARGRRPRLVLLAAAAILVGAGALVASGSLRTEPAPTLPLPTDVAAVESARPTRTGTPAPSADALFPDEVEGLPVYTVSGLLEARAAGSVSGGPIALAGYWSMPLIMHGCAAPDGDPGDLEIYCHDREYGITQRNEAAAVLTRDGRLIPASGPLITPWLPSEPWTQQLGLLPVNGQPFPPVPIVVIGHLDDERAADCRPEQRTLCEDRFVVDRIVQFDPAAVSTPPPTPTPSPFPFDSPPALALDVDRCADAVGTSDFSFVGWIDGAELSPQLSSGVDYAGETLAVAITREPVDLAGSAEREPRTDEDGAAYQLMGRMVCIVHEWASGVMGFDSIHGSQYRLYEDGLVVPTANPNR